MHPTNIDPIHDPLRDGLHVTTSPAEKKVSEVNEKKWHIGSWRDDEGQTAISHGKSEDL